MRKLIAGLAVCLATIALTLTAASAAEIKVIAANATRDALLALVPAFEKATGHKVTIVWAGSGAGEKKVLDGEAADLVLIASQNIDRLIAAGKVSGSSAPFVKSGVGIAIKAGLPKPDISNADAVKKAVLEAKSIAYSQGPSGHHVAEVLKNFGVADQIKAKLMQPPSGVQIGDLIARGEVELGFQQVSELIHVPGIQYLGPLPAEIQNYTVYSFGLVASAAMPDAAKDFVNFVRSDSAVPVIRSKGMEPD